MLRSDSAEWIDPTLPTTAARAGFLQHLPGGETGHQADFDRNRPILDAPQGDDDESRRNKFVEPYFKDAKPNPVVAVVKARQPARILIAMGDKGNDSPPSGVQTALGEPIYLLGERSAWGANVRPHGSLLSLLRTS